MKSVSPRIRKITEEKKDILPSWKKVPSFYYEFKNGSLT